ncbi:palmitoyl-protein thioesterase 1-like [Hibiscus syriacus]|uniref:Palmitoyl-protein thioesterase 1-like n=1 Tax=Hibiscus syriacus TaxID=106335 RepID=A0A6A2XMJ8_HIBSY|nr:uncharacterized protein LOC120165327 [Hibiscus syriacus]KAE8676788.1 palmitoyl-protein thioesterase 1-like [Hibiscus syriacus]
MVRVPTLKQLQSSAVSMDRWNGVFKVQLHPNAENYYRIATSLCFSLSFRSLIAPSANAIFFNGDRVQGTRNPVVERLSDPQNIAEVLASKFGGSVNVWIIEASIFNGPFAVYKDFIPSVNGYGSLIVFSCGFPASATTVSLLSNCLQHAKNAISSEPKKPSSVSLSSLQPPKTLIIGFSKGGTAVNQLVTELGSLEDDAPVNPSRVREQQPGVDELSVVQEEIQMIPTTKESLLNSITEIHYVDVGLNSSGAYITDKNVIESISKRLLGGGAQGIRFVLHGTPRQWCDSRRTWIRDEKERLYRLLESEAQRSGGRLKVYERFYFADRTPDMQMHFEVIQKWMLVDCIVCTFLCCL